MMTLPGRDSRETLSATRPLGRRPRSSHSRPAILRAARDLLRNRPAETVSMDLVATQAGVTRRTVYNQFADSAALFRATREELIREVRCLLPGPIPPAPSPCLALRRYCSAIAGTLRDARYVELMGSILRDGWAAPWFVERYQDQIRLPLMRGLEARMVALPTGGRWSEGEMRRLAVNLLGSIESLSLSAGGLLPLERTESGADDSMSDLIDGFLSRIVLPPAPDAAGA